MATVQRVGILAADQRVLAAPTENRVIPAPANEVVMSIAAAQDIGAQAAPFGSRMGSPGCAELPVITPKGSDG
jgi:hypothetical protein